MSSDHLKPLFSYIEYCFPESYAEILEKDLINKNLFSPFSLRLPQSLYSDIEAFIHGVYEVKGTEQYQQRLNLPESFVNWPKTKSLLTCFDFHYNEAQGLKLIEINTNASLYLPIILQRCAQLDQCKPPQIDVLLASFEETFNLRKGDSISIFDESPEDEGLYFEFLIFKEWLSQKGYPTNIVSLQDFAQKANDNIYNRYTDFYLAEEKSKALAHDYFSETRKFSPNPKEYTLLADKKRLTPLREELALRNLDLAEVIPETRIFKEFESKDDIWSQRKKLFFKPSEGFGSKGAFSGKSISRKAFDSIYSPEFIAQEVCPAGKQTFTKDGEEITMKFDIRVFTFEGKIQNYGARLYQGQTTNMQTPWGGIAPIDFF